MKKAVLRRHVIAALERERGYVKISTTCEQRDNPQVVEMRLVAEGRIEALEAVLLALQGDMSIISSWSEFK